MKRKKGYVYGFISCYLFVVSFAAFKLLAINGIIFKYTKILCI